MVQREIYVWIFFRAGTAKTPSATKKEFFCAFIWTILFLRWTRFKEKNIQDSDISYARRNFYVDICYDNFLWSIHSVIKTYAKIIQQIWANRVNLWLKGDSPKWSLLAWQKGNTFKLNFRMIRLLIKILIHDTFWCFHDTFRGFRDTFLICLLFKTSLGLNEQIAPYRM